MKHAYVYSKPNCNMCTLTKKWLTDRDMPFTELDITLPAHMALAQELSIQAAPMVVLTTAAPDPALPAKDVPFASKAKLPSDAIVFSGFRNDILAAVLSPLTPADIEQQAA